MGSEELKGRRRRRCCCCYKTAVIFAGQIEQTVLKTYVLVRLPSSIGGFHESERSRVDFVVGYASPVLLR